MMAALLEDKREVRWLEGVVVGSVLGPYFGVTALPDGTLRRECVQCGS